MVRLSKEWQKVEQRTEDITLGNTNQDTEHSLGESYCAGNYVTTVWSLHEQVSGQKHDGAGEVIKEKWSSGDKEYSVSF